MPQIEISDADLAFLKDLAHEIKTQNNRATAHPYYFTVQRKRRFVGADASLGGETVWIDHGSGDYTEYATEEAAIAQIIFDGVDPKEAQKYFDENFKEYGVFEYEEDVNVFFTMKGFREHMRLNAHNYGGLDPDNYKDTEKVYSYCHHAFRNPEIKTLLEIIQRLGATDDTGGSTGSPDPRNP